MIVFRGDVHYNLSYCSYNLSYCSLLLYSTSFVIRTF